jgi:predicted ribosome quality control (RQC) complex YloA/Tae2 family protein
LLLNYYIIRSLASEWADPESESSLIGSVILEAWSSSAEELTLLLGFEDGEEVSLRICVKPGLSYTFRQPGAGKPRKNTTPLFKALYGQTITGVAVADRDRVLDVRTDGGLTMRSFLFGSAANALVLDPAGELIEAFRSKAALRSVPESRPAPNPVTAEDIEARWPSGAQMLSKALTRAMPLFDRWLAEEAVARAGLSIEDSSLAAQKDFEKLAVAVHSVREDLNSPTPILYRDERTPITLSLIELSIPPGEPQLFESVDTAVRALVRATLSEQGFRTGYEPLLTAVEQAAVRARQGLVAMEKELTRPSRADQYEKWGHLLMASEAGASAGREAVVLADLFGAGESVTIPLNDAQSGLENANRYYDRARRSRRAREEATRRVTQARAWALETAGILEEVRAVEDGKGLKAFLKSHADGIARIRGKSGKAKDGIPFRVYTLPSGYVVWVGRNAKQNDQLTFKHARKHDLWMHARGVAGSHTVLRRDSKTTMPPPAVLDQAAGIAAWHSKARGSELVPVIVTERKYVRSPRKALPGAVLVDREEVLIVTPRVPKESN